MSAFHCSCGFAIDDAEGFADHLGWVFDRDDDLGTDGGRHAEIVHDGPPRHLCSCGHAAGDSADFNDHLLLMVIPPDGIGLDGERHIPVDLATPHRFHVRERHDGY